MPKPYSYDLRQKVIEAIKLDGLKINEASYLFNRASKYDRLMVETASPNRERKKRYPINLRVMVIKLPQGEKFRENALTHGDKTQVEMASLWEGEISDRTISRALKKIGFTRKKRPTATANGMKSNARRL